MKGETMEPTMEDLYDLSITENVGDALLMADIAVMPIAEPPRWMRTVHLIRLNYQMAVWQLHKNIYG